MKLSRGGEIVQLGVCERNEQLQPVNPVRVKRGGSRHIKIIRASGGMADAQGLGPCVLNGRGGSTPLSPTKENGFPPERD